MTGIKPPYKIPHKLMGILWAHIYRVHDCIVLILMPLLQCESFYACTFLKLSIHQAVNFGCNLDIMLLSHKLNFSSVQHTNLLCLAHLLSCMQSIDRLVKLISQHQNYTSNLGLAYGGSSGNSSCAHCCTSGGSTTGFSYCRMGSGPSWSVVAVLILKTIRESSMVFCHGW